MPSHASPAPPSLAASLRPLLRTRKQRLSVGEMLARIEDDRGIGPVLFALTLPALLPFPPGFTMLLALPLLVAAPQIAAGRQRLWLPRALSRITVKRSLLIRLLRRVLPLVERAETVVRPRLGWLTGRIGARAVGATCTLVALVLILPIPFGNLLPSIAMSAFSLGLTRRDGLMILAGYALTLLALAVIVLGAWGIGLGLHHLRAEH